MAIVVTFDQKDRGSILVEVYSGDSGSGGYTTINTCVSLGGDRELFSLTLCLS